MTRNAWISIRATQNAGVGEPVTMELATEGEYDYEPGLVRLSYVETAVTGFEGVVTSFTVEDERSVTVTREGTVSSAMLFVRGERHEALYDVGLGAMIVTVSTRSLAVLLNERGGVIDLEYEVEIEHEFIGVNRYRIQIRTNEKGEPS